MSNESRTRRTNSASHCRAHIFVLLGLLVICLTGQRHAFGGEQIVTDHSLADARVDLSRIESPEWQTAINAVTSRGAMSRPITLLRVMLDDDGIAPSPRSAEPTRPMFNGVPLFIPQLNFDLSDDFRRGTEPPVAGRKETVQVVSSKLNNLDSFPSGGGMYREVQHGAFVIVEHVNSRSRVDGKDPVDVGSFAYGSAKLWVPVPPRGELGILGDVILKRTPPDGLGRIVAEIVDNTHQRRNLGSLQVGNKIVGGPYGRHYNFSEQGFASSDQLSPGTYKIVLPGFNLAKSRWDVTVEPGRVTYLRFRANTGQPIQLQGQQILDFSSREETGRE